MTTIIEFFNPNDISHIRAYQHLQNYGVWPVEWQSTLAVNKIERPPGWQLLLANKMADAWVEHMDIAHCSNDGC